MKVSTIDSFILGRTMGSGAEGKVKEGILPDGSRTALKIFFKDRPGFY